MSYERQCVAAVQTPSGDVRRCDREAVAGDPGYLTLIPICSWHADKARRHFAAPLHDELDGLKRQAAEHECDGDKAVAAHLEERHEHIEARTKRYKARAVAYFIRCGEYVKIGASASPLYRLDTIRRTGGVLAPRGLDLSASELINVEPGGFEREKELHIKFAHLREVGEWFRETPELIDYIESLSEAAA